MQTQDIIRQLYASMPSLNTHFSVIDDDFSVEVNGNTVTVTTIDRHELVDGSSIVMSGARVQTIVSTYSVDEETLIVSCETLTNHDLTEAQTATVRMATQTNPDFNSTFELLTVPNRRNFTFQYEGPEIENPGALFLLEERSFGGINGVFNVTVVDANTFTYEISIPTGTPDISGAVISLGIRISGASDIERAISCYTEQKSDTDLWGFVVVDNPVSNKDRNVTNDATANQGGLNDWNILYLEPFSFYVVVPTPNDITGRRARDLCDSIRPDIFNCLLGIYFPSGFQTSSASATYPLGDDFFGYFKSYYIHQFRFEQVSRVTTEDVTNYNDNVAFRDIKFEISDIITNDNSVKLTGNVDLDDDPLE